MTREEVLELTLQVVKGKMWWETNGETIVAWRYNIGS